MQRHNCFKWLIVIAFSITIYTPLLVSIWSDDKQVSLTEKRNLADRPDFPESMDSLKSFPKAFETYFNDHFGLRDEMVKLHNRISFTIEDSSAKDVVIGKDGWLFLCGRGYSYPVRDYRNMDLFTIEQLSQFAGFLTAKYLFLKKRGVKYLLVVAPNKHTIYGEKLPDYITKINNESSLTQLVVYLQKNTDVPIVDLRPILTKNKNNAFSVLYDKYDSHWNFYGANFAQYEIAGKIDFLLPNRITPYLYKPDEFQMMTSLNADLANLMGLMDELTQNHRVPQLRQPVCNQSVIGETGPKPHAVVCENSALRAVVFRDSFFNHLEHYFTRYFKYAKYFLKQASITDFEQMLEDEKPDIVIEEFVERTLSIITDSSVQYGDAFKRQKFNGNDGVVFDLGCVDLKEIETHNLEIFLDPQFRPGDALQVRSIGPDPTMVLPDIDFDPDSNYIMKIKIHSSQNDMFQLFFSVSGEAGSFFSEENSVVQLLTKGDNEFFILLENEHLGQKLRIDPGAGVGKFRIDGFEIKKIDNMDYIKDDAAE